MRFYLNLLCLSLLTLAFTGLVTPTVAAENPAAQYAAVLAQWSELNKQLDGLQAKFSAASPEGREAVRAEYIQLLGQLNQMLPKLEAAAVAAYDAAPNQDEEQTKLLIGIAANNLANDRYDAALALASKMIKAGCQEKALYGIAGEAAYCTDDFAAAEAHLTTARDAEALARGGMMYLTDLAQAKKLWAKEQALRQAEAAAADLPRVLMKTTKGDLVIELYENEAPQTVGNFVSLVEKGYYNGLIFHRVLPGFMAQGGCPTGTGTGGPGYNILCECQNANHRNHFRGTLSMAHAGKDTGGSQFFLTFRRTSHLDGVHTVFGRVVEGLDVLDKLERVDPQNPDGTKPDKIIEAKVLRKRNHVYQPTKA